jgi:chromosome segregation ATPase
MADKREELEKKAAQAKTQLSKAKGALSDKQGVDRELPTLAEEGRPDLDRLKKNVDDAQAAVGELEGKLLALKKQGGRRKTHKGSRKTRKGGRKGKRGTRRC